MASVDVTTCEAETPLPGCDVELLLLPRCAFRTRCHRLNDRPRSTGALLERAAADAIIHTGGGTSAGQSSAGAAATASGGCP